jgi:hypothetical protein
MKSFQQFINENEEGLGGPADLRAAELAAMQDLIRFGLATPPMESLQAALEEDVYELVENYGEIGLSQGPDDTILARIEFDPDYHFPDIEEDLAAYLEIGDDVRLRPEISLSVQIDPRQGKLTYHVSVEEDRDVSFHDVEVIEGKPDEQWAMTDPEWADNVLSAIQSFIEDGPLVDGQQSTEIYSAVLKIYSRHLSELKPFDELYNFDEDAESDEEDED